MADIVNLAASATAGGLFGLLGTVTGRLAGYFERRQTFEQERAKWVHESALMQLQMQANRQETEAQIELRDVSGRWEGLSASLQADAAIGASYPWVNAIRGLTRPSLTFLLWLITAGLFMAANPTEQASIIETATFAATAATLWWFGDRGPRRPSQTVP